MQVIWEAKVYFEALDKYDAPKHVETSKKPWKKVIAFKGAHIEP